LSMRDRMARSKTSSLLLLAFTASTLLTLPPLTESSTVEITNVLQTTTVSTATTSNTTLTSGTSTQTDSTSTTTTATTTQSSWQWDLLIPILVIGVGAGLTVMVAAVVATRRRRRGVMPAVQLICPRCRAPVSPYDTACRNCRTPLYHPYRFYPRRR